MSDIEDQRNKENFIAEEGKKNAWVEHMEFLSRELLLVASYYDPRVIAFKERRKVQSMKLRWPVTGNALPKKRVGFSK